MGRCQGNIAVPEEMTAKLRANGRSGCQKGHETARYVGYSMCKGEEVRR